MVMPFPSPLVTSWLHKQGVPAAHFYLQDDFSFPFSPPNRIPESKLHITLFPNTSMDPTPPAWLRSYKAQSAHIPNFASQVRTELDGKPATKEPPNPKFSEEKETKGNNANDDTTPANQFTFPSTISLTLHNVVSLDKSYSNSTPESSPKKETFHPRLEQHPALREKGLALDDAPSQKRRGTMCRLLAAIRKVLASKTQHRLAH